MSIQETESGKIIGKQDGTIKEFKEEFYKFVESSAIVLEAQDYQEQATFVIISTDVDSYIKMDDGFECDSLTVLLNKDDFSDEGYMRYLKRHEAAEIWTVLKPGFAIESPIEKSNGKLEVNIDALQLTHCIGARESFRLAVSEGRGRDFFNFLESKIREYCEGKGKEEDIQTLIQQQRLALGKAEDEKARGFLK